MTSGRSRFDRAYEMLGRALSTPGEESYALLAEAACLHRDAVAGERRAASRVDHLAKAGEGAREARCGGWARATAPRP